MRARCRPAVAAQWKAGITAASNSVCRGLRSGWVDKSFPLADAPHIGEWAMLMNRQECRDSDKRDRLGSSGTRPGTEFDLKAVRVGIGAAIRTIHSDVLREEIPDRIAELLRQLDEPKDVGGG